MSAGRKVASLAGMSLPFCNHDLSPCDVALLEGASRTRHLRSVRHRLQLDYNIQLGTRRELHRNGAAGPGRIGIEPRLVAVCACAESKGGVGWYQKSKLEFLIRSEEHT